MKLCVDFRALLEKYKAPTSVSTGRGLEVGSGGRIRTYDLWVLIPMFEPPAVITLLPAD